MFCRKCGKEISDDALFCEYCGEPTNNQPYNNQFDYNNQMNANQYNYQQTGGFIPSGDIDHSSFGLSAVSFFFPIVGIIFYILWHNTYPLKANSCKNGLIAVLVVYIVMFIIWMLIIMAAANGTSY
ncbi:MAG: zinc-ribbon domain-containing protein [Thomasclavelia sp.]|jgi:uncharacterized membrane protein YvbJ|nr:zinc-ribbon domain-containing protein [Thomasclavelia sp.]